MQAALTQRDSTHNLNEFVQQMQSSTTALKSIQKQISTEFNLSAEERENHLKNRERELDKREENLVRQQRETEKEQKNLQLLLSKMDERLRELQYTAEDEKRRLQQDAKQLDVRRAEFEIETRSVRENLDKEQRRIQALREEKIREKEDFLAEMMQERRVLAGLLKRDSIINFTEERRNLEDSRRRLSENDEAMLRRVREKEVSLDAERNKLIHDKNELVLEKESFAREKERIIKEKVQLQEEQEAFQAQAAELTKVGFEVQQKSEQVARLHETAQNERLASQQLRDEAQNLYLKTEKDKSLIEDKEVNLTALQKTLEKQRVEIARDRKQLSEDKEEARKTIEAAKALSKAMQTSQTKQVVAAKEQENTELANLVSEFTPQPSNAPFPQHVLRNKDANTLSMSILNTTKKREKLGSWDRQEASKSLEQQQRFLQDVQFNVRTLSSSGSLQPMQTTLHPFRSSYTNGM